MGTRSIRERERERMAVIDGNRLNNQGATVKVNQREQRGGKRDEESGSKRRVSARVR